MTPRSITTISKYTGGALVLTATANKALGMVNDQQKRRLFRDNEYDGGYKICARSVEVGLPDLVTKALGNIGISHYFVKTAQGKEIGQGTEQGIPLEGGHWDMPLVKTCLVDHKGQGAKSSQIPLGKWYESKTSCKLDLDSEKFEKMLEVGRNTGFFGAPKRNPVSGEYKPNFCYQIILDMLEECNKNNPEYRPR